ncbi:MAG: YMGG-like glycine zipper-containing protein [Pseudomonadota bacterium]
MNYIVIFVAASALMVETASGQSACLSAPASPSGQGDVAKTAAVGAIAGGLLGGLLGNAKDKDETTKGAAVGAVIGGLTGAAVGKVASDRRHAYDTEASYLQCEIDHARQELAQHEKLLSEANANLTQTRARTAELNRLYAAGQVSLADLEAIRRTVSSNVELLDDELNGLKLEIEYLEGVKAEPASATSEDVAVLEARRIELTHQKEQLTSTYYALAQIRQDMQVAGDSLGRSG